MKALTIQENRTAAVVDIPVQSRRKGYNRVRAVAWAVNPTDGDHVTYAGPVGGILGCDFAGVVEEIGEDCSNTTVAVGDRVFCAVHGGNNGQLEDGAYAEYVMVRDGHLARIPDGMSFEEAAVLGCATITIGQTLFMTLSLPLDEAPPHTRGTILINGGSTACGSMAIQFAALIGMRVVATCSPKNFQFVTSRGADLVFDYADPDAGKKINDATGNQLRYAMDCISTEKTFPLVAAALSNDASVGEIHCIGLLPVDAFPRSDVKARSILSYTTMGESFEKFGQAFPAFPSHFEYGVSFMKTTEKLLAEGKIQRHPAIVRPGGLHGLIQGIKDVNQGRVSAGKLVYRAADTDLPGAEKYAGEHVADDQVRWTGTW